MVLRCAHVSFAKTIKALPFPVLIKGALQEFIWHYSLSSPGPITVSLKIVQPINLIVYVIRSTRAHLLFLFFFLSNVLEM